MELGEAPAGREQLVVGALLDHAPAVDEHDAVGGADAAQTVRHDHAGARDRVTAERRGDGRLVLGVERTRRLVDEQHRSGLQQRTCDRHALALAAREGRARLAHPTVPAVRQTIHDPVDASERGGGLQTGVVGMTGPASFGTYRVALTAANGAGNLGEVLSSPLVLAPDIAVTQSFITIGAFDSETEAEACLKYVKSKFARTMLGVLKITQHNPAKTWKHVPLQDFTSNSDIDWSKPIAEIDQQLYAKYKLDTDEIEFIETHVKPMD